MAEVLERSRFDGFASLVRHPDLDESLSGRVNLAALDESFCEHLPLGPDSLLVILEQPKAATIRLRRTGRRTAEPVETLPHEVLCNVRELLAPLLRAVTAEEIRSLARDIFKTSSLNLALIGPVKDEEPLRRLLTLD